MEELVGVIACVLGDMASWPNFGLNELNFVFSTLVVGSDARMRQNGHRTRVRRGDVRGMPMPAH